MIVMSYANAGVNAALNADGALKPYYMGLDLPTYSLPLIAFGTVAVIIIGAYLGMKVLERFF